MTDATNAEEMKASARRCRWHHFVKIAYYYLIQSAEKADGAGNDEKCASRLEEGVITHGDFEVANS